ncbi:MAG: segregation/condensation protein A [Eubacteriales bacterium]
MAIPVKLQAFEGPLDLLLHLIDKNKVDIYDIPIVMITEQYMDYMKAIQSDGMEVMSEFLVMAATLLRIKCKMLLPIEPDEDGEVEDPREELMYQLLEYKKYKQISFELRNQQEKGQMVIYKQSTIPEEVQSYALPIDYEYLIGDMNLGRLNQIFQQMMKRQEDKIDPIRSTYGKIEKDEVNMEERMSYVRDLIAHHKELSFRALLEEQPSKMSVVITFLVILELMKVGAIVIEQTDLFDDITIRNQVML